MSLRTVKVALCSLFLSLCDAEKVLYAIACLVLGKLCAVLYVCDTDGGDVGCIIISVFSMRVCGG